MKAVMTITIALLLVSGCTRNLGKDHYYCNKHETREKYEICMEAGEKVE